jgi:hypothetical protein
MRAISGYRLMRSTALYGQTKTAVSGRRRSLGAAHKHTAASLYAAFPAAEARRLAERFEWHYTPKHGSRLDMAESELAVLAAQCLDRRIPDKETLPREVAAWQENRNRRHVKTNWQFTTSDARCKLKFLYPQFQ